MLIKLLAISAFIGLLFYLMSKDSNRNDVYHKSKSEEDNLIDDERNDTDH